MSEVDIVASLADLERRVAALEDRNARSDRTIGEAMARFRRDMDEKTRPDPSDGPLVSDIKAIMREAL